MFFSLPVLMYHSISGFKHRLCVSPKMFEDHCAVLARAGWRGIPLAEAEEYFLKKRRLPRKTCLFTFDDGYLDNYVYAEPLLRRHGHSGAIFPVADFVESGARPRPNLEDMEQDSEKAKNLPPLDKRPPTIRNGRRVAGITFCNWAELRAMRDRGCLAAAPHSLRHGRVLRRLTGEGLYMPRAHGTFFGTPPFDIPYGFPRFELGHALADRAYVPEPALFELVRKLVPQKRAEAEKFLSTVKNRQTVLDAVAKLPCPGRFESEEDYRARLAEEFAACRERFLRELGSAPVSFCWPWGRYNAVALEEARKAGFKVFFSTGRRPNRLGNAASVHRISVRGESGRQLLHKLRFASNALLEGIHGWLEHRVDPKLSVRK